MAMPVLAALHKPTAAELAQITNQIDSLTDPNWVDYSASFVFSATVTPPTKGNSVYNAHYRRPAGADWCIVRVFIAIGSTFSAGSGTYSWSLPFTASSAWGGSIGALYVFDSGVAPRGGGIVKLESTTTMTGVMGTSAITHNSPNTWGTSDEIKFTVVYETA